MKQQISGANGEVSHLTFSLFLGDVASNGYFDLHVFAMWKRR